MKKTSISEAKNEIALAVKDAGTLIAKQAADAVQVIAAAAATALKVDNVKGIGDHDSITTLIETVSGLNLRFSEKFDELKADIKDLKDGTATRITKLEAEKLNTADSYPVLYKADVDKKLDELEKCSKAHAEKITIIMTWGSVAVLLVGVLEFIISRLWR